MHTPVPPFNSTPAPAPTGLVRNALHEDVQWNRPIFRAPPLQLDPQSFDTSAFAEDLRRIGFGQH